MSDRFRWSLAALAVGALAAVLLTAFHLAGRADRELKYVEQGEASYGPVSTARRRPAAKSTTRTISRRRIASYHARLGATITI